MPAIEDDGLSPEEGRALRCLLARDPALAVELELILPALDPDTRAAFYRRLAAASRSRRPAASVLAALVSAARR